jgi:hypothetical protein
MTSDLTIEKTFACGDRISVTVHTQEGEPLDDPAICGGVDYLVEVASAKIEGRKPDFTTMSKVSPT